MEGARAPRLAESLPHLPAGPAGVSSLRSLVGTALAAGLVAAAVVIARGRLESAATQLMGASAWPLAGAAICAVLVPAATAGAWRSVLASRGVQLGATEAWGCYGLGSLANTFLPGRAGDALRIELFSRRLEQHGRRWLACGVSISVVLAQSVVFGCVLGVGAVLGALPTWALAPLFALPAVAWGIGHVARRRCPGERVAHLAAATTLSVMASVRLLGWVAASAVARLLLVIAVLEALGVSHPIGYAFVALCGLAVGNTLTPAPGGAGVAAATMSVALAHAGLPASTALAASVSLHAVETVASLLFGASGWLLLRTRSPFSSSCSTLRPSFSTSLIVRRLSGEEMAG